MQAHRLGGLYSLQAQLGRALADGGGDTGQMEPVRAVKGGFPVDISRLGLADGARCV